MQNHEVNVRLRIIIIKNDKLLVQYRKKSDFYHYVGGHLEYGETVLEGCQREIAEECIGAKFEFKKIFYIRDFIYPKENEHSFELFILGDIDKDKELEQYIDPQHPDGDAKCTWLDINNLPDNLFPHPLSKILQKDYQAGFPSQGQYVGKM